MEWNLIELRSFLAALEMGSFTDAAIELGVSQAAVSRRVAAVEQAVGERLVRRTPRGCEATLAGQQVLPQVRRIMAEADRLSDQLKSWHSTLRLGYAWAALGAHTAPLLRMWDRDYTDQELQLVHHNSPTAGLSEGLCDTAIVRISVDDDVLESKVVGFERRVVAFAADDPAWERRRRLRLEEIAERDVVIDPRVGTTDDQLWAHLERQPNFIAGDSVDTWLDTIAAGRGVGITSEATIFHHARSGVSFRQIKDAPLIPVRLVWRREHAPLGIGQLIDDIMALYE